MLKEKEIILGVTGSIAAYKAAEIASKLVQSKANVTVVMTACATKFVTPLTFQSISRNRTLVDMFDLEYECSPKHIALADKADLLLIAPATANIIGKIASGIADDLLSTLAMSVKCPIMIAPAMNVNMYNNKLVQKNIAFLKKEGYKFIDPETGYLACGANGQGRLAAIETIIKKVTSILA
ncbi:MAG: bifunctional phosphopantothenoylcysteine decarboxylase/phosphopantothenate--cysteine ligase CoaBC [Candidatus Brocadiia bacterium]